MYNMSFFDSEFFPCGIIHSLDLRLTSIRQTPIRYHGECKGKVIDLFDRTSGVVRRALSVYGTSPQQDFFLFQKRTNVG